MPRSAPGRLARRNGQAGAVPAVANGEPHMGESRFHALGVAAADSSPTAVKPLQARRPGARARRAAWRVVPETASPLRNGEMRRAGHVTVRVRFG
jgi:hypothetical protein